MLLLKSKGGIRQNPLFFLLKPSTDWTRPTYIIEGNLLHAESTDFSVNLM